MNEITGEIMELNNEQIKDVLKDGKVNSKIPITLLTDKEHQAMLDIPKQERSSELAWLRYKAETDFTEVSPIDLFVDGFRAAQKIYLKD